MITSIAKTKRRWDFWRGLALFLAVLGLVDAGYLAFVVHYGGVPVWCPFGTESKVGGCPIVLNTDYAVVHLGGLEFPVALLGFLGYLTIIGLLLLDVFPDNDFLPKNAATWGLPLVTLSGLGYSFYLLSLEITRIHAICFWCIVSLGIMILLSAISLVWLRRERRYENAQIQNPGRG